LILLSRIHLHLLRRLSGAPGKLGLFFRVLNLFFLLNKSCKLLLIQKFIHDLKVFDRKQQRALVIVRC
jgi:hypothetical protein